MGQGNFTSVKYKNDRGDEESFLKEQQGGDYLRTGKIIQNADESGTPKDFLDTGYHRAYYPDFAPPKIRPVYRKPVSKLSLKPKG